jgi:predicted nuclease of restriction endonuclease-like RecB superfamily
MNKQDQSNLNFIMSLSEEEYDMWLQTISDEYAEYAFQLFEMARAELALKRVEVTDDIRDLSKAKNILGKFTLKGTV